ncbi:MAG: hypothetical protein ACPGUY_07870, partial [Akkermansiaceae bacterium]
WVYGHRHENQLARLISRRFPKLGDRLLGAVELQDQTDAKEILSPELRAAAMRTVAADAAGRDLTQALPASRHRKWSLVVMSLFVFAVAALVTVPEAGINALKRWLMPLADTERFTFTKLDLSHINDPQAVPYGESFSVTIPLAKDTNRRPETARARYGKSGEWIEAKLVDNAYTFSFPGQRAEDKIYLEADDAQHALAYQPIVRPAIEGINVKVELPAYLQRPATQADVRSGFITALEGSSLTINAVTTRALDSANSQITHLPKEIVEEEIAPAPLDSLDSTTPPAEEETKTAKAKTPPPSDLALKVDGRTFTSAPIVVGDHPLVVPMKWTDVLGLGTDSPFKLRIESTQDQLPSTYIQGIERQHIMLAEETIDFQVLAEDDYGLKACGIEWQGEFTKPTGKDPAKGELTLEKGGPTRTMLNKPFSFSPENLDIAPQKLVLRSWTEDYKPERGRIYSEPVVIYILTRDEHAQVLKNEFDRAIGELEDISRKEQNLNDENQRLNRKKGEELQKEDNKKKLEAQQNAEAENKERMQNLTEKMENLFKDAVRNGEI